LEFNFELQRCQTSGAAYEPATVIHSGFVNKLTGKGLLTSGSWKRRFCVLDARRLYFYDTKEVSHAHFRFISTCSALCEFSKNPRQQHAIMGR
jgi:PH domain